jgi:hypothetical protein
MKLIAEKTSLECILWSGLTIIFYVKYNTGNEFQYIVEYDDTRHLLTKYSVDFLDNTVKLETITQVLNFIECYDRSSVELIEIEIII